MGQLWTDEMEAKLERWQAIKAEAANPRDFLVARNINTTDRLRGFARFATATIRYWAVGGSRPLSLSMRIACADIDRQRLADPARQKECEEWLRANPIAGDPFEGLIFGDD